MSSFESPIDNVPVFLLKTRSTPGDSYEDLFNQAHHGYTFAPVFVPVLQHRFNEEGLVLVRGVLQGGDLSPTAGAPYGGLIFTSQRAVEAFVKVVEDGRQYHGDEWPDLRTVPIYSVGPATTRALSAVRSTPPPRVFGSHTGNGDALAAFILDHYASVYPSRVPKPALLFLVGEQRRDIIPKTLMDPSLPEDRLIQVVETPIYGTGVMDSFPEDFDRVLNATTSKQTRWVVVFSPTGCEGMLRGLGLLDEDTSRVIHGVNGDTTRSTFVATIGPTTRDYLQSTFGFNADVCANTPTPEGVLGGILEFMSRLRQ